MDVNVKLPVRRGDVAKTGGPAVAVNLYAGVKTPGGATAAVDRAAGGLISRAIRNGDFKAELEEVLVLYPEPGEGVPERVIVLGLGAKDRFNPEAARRVGGTLANTLRKLKVKRAATVVHGGDSGQPLRELARALAEGILMGAYRYDAYLRDGRAERLALEEVAIVEQQAGRIRAIEEGVRFGAAVAGAVNEARELANGPSNQVTPTFMAETAKRLGSRYGFKVRALGPEECAREKMGAFLGVAKGSDEPCRFLIMEHAGGKNPRGTVCVVGKGITFDSGGISIKPADAMDQMKFDMSGGAAVIATMRLVAELEVPVRVVGLVAATENLPGGHAYKPGDILESSAGVTIEVLNTDAEGRLVLADALAYAARYQPDAVIDLATLTGACQIALASHAAGLMANDEWLLDRIQNASEASGERVWPLPLWKEYRDMVRSDVADIKNSAGRPGGAITAGAFLGAFTNGYRWAHLDIAGTAWLERAGRSYLGLGATGAGVRLLADFLTDWKRPKGKGPTPGVRTSLGSVRNRAGERDGKERPGKAEADKASPGPVAAGRRRRSGPGLEPKRPGRSRR